jgi:hypothetical protein
MAVVTKVDSIEKEVDIIINDMLSPAAQSRAFAAFAREEIKAGDELNRQILGRVPPRTVTVDGSPGSALERVSPTGTIVAEWELVVDILQWIADTLRERSPVVSGIYREGHTLFIDGVEVPMGAQIPSATEYVFTNQVPYARKLEVGKTESGRDFVVQVPNRIYERTFKDAKARFGKQVRISFGYEALVGAYKLQQDGTNRRWTSKKRAWRVSSKLSADRKAGSVVTAPAITISLRNS